MKIAISEKIKKLRKEKILPKQSLPSNLVLPVSRYAVGKTEPYTLILSLSPRSPHSSVSPRMSFLAVTANLLKTR